MKKILFALLLVSYLGFSQNANTSYDAIQAKHPPLTQNRSQTIPFFSHPYPFIPHTHSPTDLYQ